MTILFQEALLFSVYIPPCRYFWRCVVAFILVQHAVNNILRSLCCHPADVAPPPHADPAPTPAPAPAPFCSLSLAVWWEISLKLFWLLSN